MRATLFLVIVSSIFPAANAYASWLKCFVDLDSSEVVMNNIVQNFDDAPHKVEIEVREEGSTEWTQSYVYPKSGETTLEARLKLPEGFGDTTLQYVMETTAGGSFFEPEMCDGRRSFGRKVSEYVKLKIQPGQDSITLWAGYAKGHSVVALTDALVLRQGSYDEL